MTERINELRTVLKKTRAAIKKSKRKLHKHSAAATDLTDQYRELVSQDPEYLTPDEMKQSLHLLHGMSDATLLVDRHLKRILTLCSDEAEALALLDFTEMELERGITDDHNNALTEYRDAVRRLYLSATGEFTPTGAQLNDLAVHLSDVKTTWGNYTVLRSKGETNV